MMRLLNNRRGQNTAEYAILIGVIVAAAIAMQIYVRRGMQARIKSAVDYSQTADSTIFNTSQYEPYYMSSELVTDSTSKSSERMDLGGAITRDIENEFTERTGTIIYGNWSE